MARSIRIWAYFALAKEVPYCRANSLSSARSLASLPQRPARGTGTAQFHLRLSQSRFNTLAVGDADVGVDVYECNARLDRRYKIFVTRAGAPCRTSGTPAASRISSMRFVSMRGIAPLLRRP